MRKAKKKKQAPHQDIKKHVSQMTEKEKTFLLRQFKSIPRVDWLITQYAEYRLNERGVALEWFKTLWEGYDLVEFHKAGNSSRVLMRGNAVVNGDENICAVFDLKERVVITIWLNWTQNKHNNLVIEEYDSSYDILRGF